MFTIRLHWFYTVYLRVLSSDDVLNSSNPFHRVLSIRCEMLTVAKKKSLNKNWNNFFFAKPFSAKGRSYCITECHIHSTLGRRVGFEFDGHRSPMAIQRNPLITIDRLHAFLIHRRLIDGGIMDGPGVSGSNHNTDGPRFHSGPRFAYSDLVIKPSQS